MSTNYAAPAELGKTQGVAIGVGLLGIIGWIVGVVTSGDKASTFFQTYLVAYVFWIGISLGCLGLLMVQYLGGGGWGLIIRRQLESASSTLWMMAVLFIPIVMGLHSIYHWSHPISPNETEPIRKLLTHKAQWLNPGGFTLRAVMYFAIWLGLTYTLRKWSAAQDKTPDPNEAQTWVQKAQNLSGPGFLIYAMAVTFASIDWIMSLDAEWYSTIFGMLTTAGQGVLSIAFLISVSVVLSKHEPMAHVLKPKHFHDLGKLQLALVMVWAYFSFSQLLIIWSGNLPEEIPWFIRRFDSNTPWRWMGIGLLLLHFVMPFLLLLSRDLKKASSKLVWVARLLIVMRLVDLIWVMVPQFDEMAKKTGHGHVAGPAQFAIYAAATIGMGGLWLGWFFWQLRQRPLIPFNDPQLAEAASGGGGH